MTDNLSETLEQAKLANDTGNQQLAEDLIKQIYYNKLSSGDNGSQNLSVNSGRNEQGPVNLIKYNPRAYLGELPPINPNIPKFDKQPEKESFSLKNSGDIVSLIVSILIVLIIIAVVLYFVYPDVWQRIVGRFRRT